MVLELIYEGAHALQRLLGPQPLDLPGLAFFFGGIAARARWSSAQGAATPPEPPSGAAARHLVVHRATSCSTIASTSSKLPSTGSLNPVPNWVSTASTSTTTVSGGRAPK